jgi:hypothetical protein
MLIPQLPPVRDFTDAEYELAREVASQFFDTDLRDGTHTHDQVHQWFLDQTGDEDLAKYTAILVVMSILVTDYGMTQEQAMDAVGVQPA